MDELRALGVEVERQPAHLGPRAPDPAAPPRRSRRCREEQRGARQDRHHPARHRALLRGQGRPARAPHGRPAAARPRFPDKLAEARRHYEQILRGARPRRPDVDWDGSCADLAAFGERHRRRIVDVSLVLHRHIGQGYSVLFEGAQAHAARHRPRHLPVRHLARAAAAGGAAPARACRRRASTASSASPRPTPRASAAGRSRPRSTARTAEQIRERGQRVRRDHRPAAALRLVRRGGRALRGARQRLRHAGPHQARRARRAGRRSRSAPATASRARPSTEMPAGHAGPRGLRAGLRDAAGLEGAHRRRARLGHAARERPALRRAPGRARRAARSASSRPAPTASRRSSAAAAPWRAGSSSSPVAPRRALSSRKPGPPASRTPREPVAQRASIDATAAPAARP